MQLDLNNVFRTMWHRHVRTDARPAQAQAFTWAK